MLGRAPRPADICLRFWVVFFRARFWLRFRGAPGGVPARFWLPFGSPFWDFGLSFWGSAVFWKIDWGSSPSLVLKVLGVPGRLQGVPFLRSKMHHLVYVFFAISRDFWVPFGSPFWFPWAPPGGKLAPQFRNRFGVGSRPPPGVDFRCILVPFWSNLGSLFAWFRACVRSSCLCLCLFVFRFWNAFGTLLAWLGACIPTENRRGKQGREEHCQC